MAHCTATPGAVDIREIVARLDHRGLLDARSRPLLPVDRHPPPERPADLAPWIEHTLLRPDARLADIWRLCDEAREHRFRGVCVQPVYVCAAREQLAERACRVVTVIGFPLGATLPDVKAREAELCVSLGADEIDMVLALGAVKDGRLDAAYEDIRQVVQAAGPAPVKVIIETALLTDEEKAVSALLAVRAGAAFVKTSTGFAAGGATVSDVRLIREVVGETAGIKAAGGIRTAADARALIAAGATRLGCSASVAIVTE